MSDPTREALEAELDRLDPNGAFWDYTTRDGDSHVLLKNHGLALRLAAALSTTPAPLDEERLAVAIRDALTYPDRALDDGFESYASARDMAEAIAREYAKP